MTENQPVALTRGHKKKARTRRLLLDAGMKVLAEKGEAFTANNVTEVANVSVGTFYNYFEDRDSLIDAITEDQLYSLSESIAAQDLADPALRVALTAGQILRIASSDEFLGRLILRLVTRPAIYNQVNGNLVKDIDEGFASGRFGSGPDDTTLDQWQGLLLMTIRRIIAGAAQEDVVEKTILRSLIGLGMKKSDAQKQVSIAMKMLSTESSESAA